MPDPSKPPIAFHRIDAEDRKVLEGLLTDIQTRRQLTVSEVLEPKLDAELDLIQRLLQ